jgi:hypothetical protein
VDAEASPVRRRAAEAADRKPAGHTRARRARVVAGPDADRPRSGHRQGDREQR